MFHIDDVSLRVRECSSTSCLLDHRRSREEAEEILAVLKSSLAPQPQDRFTLDEELLRKTDLIYSQAALAKRHIITRLPFADKLVVTRDHAGNFMPMPAWHETLATIEEGFRYREYSTSEMTQVTLFLSHAQAVLETYRSILPLHVRYGGWTRYWAGASDLVHVDFACSRLLEDPRVIPELSGIVEQKVLADATVNHCTGCFQGASKLKGKPKSRGIMIPLVGNVRSMNWSITPRGSIWALQVQVGDEVFLEPLSAKAVKAIRLDRSRWDAVMKTFLPMVFHRVDFAVTLEGIFRQAHGFTRWSLLSKEPDPLRRIRLLALLQDDPTRTMDETRRMVALTLGNRDGRWPFATQLPGYHQPGKASASTMLNLYDFLINGDNDETYGEFLATEAGRRFPIGGSQSATALGKNRISSYDVNLTLGVIYKLAKRSASLDAFLRTCNRLVLLGIGEMVRSTRADGVPLTPLLAALESFRLLRGSNEIVPIDREERDLTWRVLTVDLESYKAIFGSSLAQEARFAINTFMDEGAAFIHDAPSLGILFFYHAAQALGPGRAVEFISAIVDKTGGMRVDAFMKLVAAGGFSPDAPPALQIFGALE